VPAEQWHGVTLARVLRARGRKGEVAAEIFTDFPKRLTHLREAWLWDGHSAPRRTVVLSCWLHKSHAIFHFEGCDSIAAADELSGLEIQVPLAERMPLSQGRYYVTDLIGCAVWEKSSSGKAPAQLGTVRDVQPTGASIPGVPLLVVDSASGELLIPLAEEICTSIDLAARRIEVVLPEGLLDLNRG
jgi:16S rRNA processing protein RimM